MDFTKIGFKAVWRDNEAQAKSDSWGACIYLVVFLWFSLNLLIAIIRTIGTSPGDIPEDREWDMDDIEEDEQVAADDSSADETVKLTANIPEPTTAV